MRFDFKEGRAYLAPVLGLLLAATLAACSSGGSSSSTPSTAPSSSAASSATQTPAGGSSSAASGGSAAAIAAIKTNWEAFFNGQTSAAKKISLLQNGQKFAAVINAQAGSGLASSAGAKVTAVVVNSATSATVTYDITLSGATALGNQTGTAVYEGGTWKVGDVSFCQLLKLENAGSSPSVCAG